MKLISYSKQIGGIVEFCYWTFPPLQLCGTTLELYAIMN